MPLKKIIHISSKSGRIALRTFEILLALFLVTTGMLFWRLSVSPMNVDFLLPKLVDRLVPKELALKVSAEKITLHAAVRPDGILHLDIKNLVVMREDDTVVTDLPGIEMSYRLWRILSLNYIPDSLTVRNPLVQAIVDPSGNFYLQTKWATNEPAREETTSAQQATQTSEPTPVRVGDIDKIIKYISAFNRIEISDAQMFLDDQKRKKQFSIPSLDLLMQRTGRFEYSLTTDAKVAVDEDGLNLKATAVLNTVKHQMPFEVEFNSFDLRILQDMIPEAKGFNLNLKGDIVGSLDLTRLDELAREIVQTLSFKIENEEKGTVFMPAPLSNEYKVDTMLVQGAFSAHLDTLKVDQSQLTTGGTTASLNVDITGIGDFLDNGDLNKVKTVLKSIVQNVKTEEVPNLWPATLGPDAHAWVKQNISQGAISTADFTLYFSGAELADLYGKVEADGVSVDYLNPMPIATDVRATVELYPDKVIIKADKGHVNDLQLTDADIHLTELQDKISNAAIYLKGAGPVKEVMQLIDSKPLEFATAFGLNPKQTDGTGSVEVSIQFPLIETLNINQVKVKVVADIENGVFPTPIPNELISNGAFHLTVDNEKLVLDGTADLHTVPLSLKWTERFPKTKKNPIQSVYDIQGKITADLLEKEVPALAGIMTGSADTTVKVQKNFSGKADINVNADLTNSELTLYPISATKKLGDGALLSVDTVLSGNKAPDTFKFNLESTKDQIFVKGTYKTDGKINLVLDKVAAPKTSFSGQVIIDNKSNSTIKLTGKSWDAHQLFDMPYLKKDTNADTISQEDLEKETIANVQIAPPNVNLNIDLKKLVLDEKKTIRNVQAIGIRNGIQWKNLHVSADSGKTGSDHASRLEINYIPQTKQLQGELSNLGEFLDALELSERFFGGHARLSAKQNKTGAFVGAINVREFNLKDPGFLIQAGTILGIVDGIRGKELNFERANVPFELTPYQNLYITDGYAAGTSLGITFKGKIVPDKIALSGQVIPAYAINSLPGKIPLIGGLFKDGNGGGLMGVRYDIKGTPFKPQVNFNALSSIAPGILGSLFQ